MTRRKTLALSMTCTRTAPQYLRYSAHAIQTIATLLSKRLQVFFFLSSQPLLLQFLQSMINIYNAIIVIEKVYWKLDGKIGVIKSFFFQKKKKKKKKKKK